MLYFDSVGKSFNLCHVFIVICIPVERFSLMLPYKSLNVKGNLNWYGGHQERVTIPSRYTCFSDKMIQGKISLHFGKISFRSLLCLQDRK